MKIDCDGYMDNNISTTHVVSNLFWRLAERFGAQGVTLLVSIILARLLEPDVYGTVALITVITSILQVFLDGGFSTALIQKKDADDIDFSSVFYFNVVFGIILYGLLFFASPIISEFYQMPELTSVIRVLGLTLIVFSLKSVQQAYISRNMLFKKFFFATLGGTIGAAVIGIALAYLGYGVWALVAQHLFNMIVDTIILWITVKWRPKAVFSITRLKLLLSYGWKLLTSSLLETIYNNIQQLIIGKMYTSSDLAFYNQGKKYTEAIVSNINASIDSVLLPVMAKAQDSVITVKNMTRRSIKVCTYIIMPMMMGIAVCAEPLVKLLLTEKWLPCVPYMRIFCFTLSFLPIHTANLNAIKALGRSDLFLKLEIIKKVMGVSVLVATMWYGPLIMAYSLLLTSVLSQIINSWPNKKLLNYSYIEQLKDMLPQIGLSCLMGGLVFCVTLFGLSDILTLLIQIPLGVIIYVVGSKVFHIDSFEYIISIAKQYMPKKKKEA